jgi:hypothetical protein
MGVRSLHLPVEVCACLWMPLMPRQAEDGGGASRVLARVEKSIAAGDFYAALQLALSVWSRYVT